MGGQVVTQAEKEWAESLLGIQTRGIPCPHERILLEVAHLDLLTQILS